MQINYIVRDALGRATEPEFGYATAAAEIYQSISDTLRRHLGRITLMPGGGYADDQLANLLLLEPNVKYCLDADRLACRSVEKLPPDHQYRMSTSLKPAHR